MVSKERILLKIGGAAMVCPDNPSQSFILSLAHQIHQLVPRYQWAIVVGGGNFFRGNHQGKQYGLTASAGHQIGMVATVMNALILQDIFMQQGLNCTVLSAQPMTGAGIMHTAHQAAIIEAYTKSNIIIFAGGIGAPFFTTDTNAIVRALQIGAQTIWKATTVDGIYNADPSQHSNAQRYFHITYQQALRERLEIMDLSALALASEHNLIIRVFNIFYPDALLRASQDSSFGSTLSCQERI